MGDKDISNNMMVQEGQLLLKGEKVSLAKRLLKWGFNDPK